MGKIANYMRIKNLNQYVEYLKRFWRGCTTVDESELNLFPFIQYKRFNNSLSEDTNSVKRQYLHDKFNRFHSYLRISLTEKCNFRCKYCVPEEGPICSTKDYLNSLEFIMVAKVLVNAGINKIRLTGGEPTIHPDFPDLVRNLGQLNIHTFGMTSNGFLIKKYLSVLKDSKMNSINISLDSLIPARYEYITGMNGFKKVFSNILRLVDEDFCCVKINCVVMKDFNDDEIIDFVELTKDLMIHVRFIEYMPFKKNGWSACRLVKEAEILYQLKEYYGEENILKISDSRIRNDSSTLYKIRNYIGYFGLISSITNPFCGSCNRLRLLSNGTIKNCLFGIKEYPLKPILRSHMNFDDMEEQILMQVKHALSNKSYSHHLDVGKLKEESFLNRSMNQMGG